MGDLWHSNPAILVSGGMQLFPSLHHLTTSSVPSPRLTFQAAGANKVAISQVGTQRVFA